MDTILYTGLSLIGAGILIMIAIMSQAIGKSTSDKKPIQHNNDENELDNFNDRVEEEDSLVFNAKTPMAVKEKEPITLVQDIALKVGIQEEPFDMNGFVDVDKMESITNIRNKEIPENASSVDPDVYDYESNQNEEQEGIHSSSEMNENDFADLDDSENNENENAEDDFLSVM